MLLLGALYTKAWAVFLVRCTGSSSRARDDRTQLFIMYNLTTPKQTLLQWIQSDYVRILLSLQQAVGDSISPEQCRTECKSNGQLLLV